MALPFKTEYSVINWRKLGGRYLVIFDYMEFPPNSPARNLYAYSPEGEELWRGEEISTLSTDAYTNFINDDPLIVGNFCGYNVTIDINSGKVLKKEFTK